MARLLDFWDRSEIEEFQWGVNDCALWTASYIEAVTGVDPAREYRGVYSTKGGARRLIQANGGFLALCDKVLIDFPSGETQNGVAMIENQGQQAMAVLVYGAAWLKNKKGLSMIKKPEIVKGWTVWPKQ